MQIIALLFREQALGGFAEVNIRTFQLFDELLVLLTCEIELRSAGRILLAHPVEAALQAVDAFGIAVGVLIAGVTIVPIENVKAAVRPDLQ